MSMIDSQAPHELVDVSGVEDLEASLDLESTAEVIEAFLEELDELCVEYVANAVTMSEEEERALAHKIKGCAASASATALAALASEIEKSPSPKSEREGIAASVSDVFNRTRLFFQQRYNLD